jgi:parvulin-like peptidyl-prolyl isomerase
MKQPSPELLTAAVRHRPDLFDFSRGSTRRSMIFFASGALLGLAIAGYGLFTAKGTRTHTVPPEDLALVNNRAILRSDFVTQVQSDFSTPFPQTTADQRARVLGEMLAEELQVQRGLEIDLASFDPDVRAAMVAGVQLEITADVQAQVPTDQALHDYYERHRDRYIDESVFRMRELVAKVSTTRSMDQAGTDARQAIDGLRSGQPLTQVMQRYHLEDSGTLMDAGHVDNGDIFEFAARAKLSPEVYRTASRLSTGEFSDPVEQTDGVHIIVMVEHRVPPAPTYESAADKVWTDYKNDAEARVREGNIKYLRERADILLSSDAEAIEAAAK